MLVIFLLLQPYSGILEAISNPNTTRPVQPNAMLQTSHPARVAPHMTRLSTMVFTLVSKSPLLVKRAMAQSMLASMICRCLELFHLAACPALNALAESTRSLSLASKAFLNKIVI